MFLFENHDLMVVRWFGDVERENGNNWVKRCMTWEVECITERTPEKDLVVLC